LLIIEATNAIQTTYFRDCYSRILLDIRALSESITQYSQGTLLDYHQCHDATIFAANKRLVELQSNLKFIQPEKDADFSKVFIVRDFEEGLCPFEFEPSGLWKDKVLILWVSKQFYFLCSHIITIRQRWLTMNMLKFIFGIRSRS
jgi:hypothetical protein